MQLSLRSFNALVQSMAAAVEASATQLLDLTAGSTLRAVLEAMNRGTTARLHSRGRGGEPAEEPSSWLVPPPSSPEDR